MTRPLLLCLLLTGCTHEVVRYERINVAVPVLPEVPAHLLEDYPGELPKASESGVICFGEQDAKALQEWMLWHKLKVNQLRGVLKND
jgi:hypothetical protein